MGVDIAQGNEWDESRIGQDSQLFRTRDTAKGAHSLYDQSSETIKSVDSGNCLTSSDNVASATITLEPS